jgi:hypothetical protein
MPVVEWVDFIDHLVRTAVQLAGDDAQRWGELSVRLGHLPPATRKQLLDALDQFADPESLSANGRLQLWDKLNQEISRHRRYASAEWSMDDEPLSRMKAIADRLEPTSDVGRLAYLFDWHPDLPDLELGDEGYDEKLLKLRTRAVEEAIASAPISGLRTLAQRSRAPSQLGWIVGAIAPEALTPEFLTWLDSDDSSLKDTARSWASRQLADKGVPWLRTTLDRPEMAADERRVELALAAPAGSEVWDAIAEIDPSLNEAFWSSMNPWRVPPEDAERSTRELLARDRAWAAVDLLASTAHRQTGGPLGLPRELVENVLDAALESDPSEARSQSLGYEIGLLLDYLEQEGLPEEALAGYEFVFFRLLEDSRRTPQRLYRQLANNPDLFVQLVSHVYRGKNQPRRQLDQHEEAFAQHSWSILQDWRQLPGLQEDGNTIDVEHLNDWVRRARLALAESEREDIGDQQIGQVLSASPTGVDGIWPAEPVRDLVETIGSTRIEAGIHLGVVNSRGVTSRGVYDGGQQERELASRYRDWAQRTTGRWPRTSRVLRTLADSFESDARYHDSRAELTSDTE